MHHVGETRRSQRAEFKKTRSDRNRRAKTATRTSKRAFGKENVARSPHPNVPERAFPREQVDGVEHDGCCLRVVFVLISLFVVSRIFFPLFFSPFFLIKKRKKKRSFLHKKKAHHGVFIHSLNCSSKRIMATSIKRAYTRSFERTRKLPAAATRHVSST